MLEELREHFLHMARLPVEEIHVWFVDGAGAITDHWVAATGGRRDASVSLREMFRLAWVHNAHGLLIAHNHPSGDSIPSLEDEAFTASVRELGEKCEAVLLDHIVVGKNSCYSFAQDEFFDFIHALPDAIAG